MTQQMNRGQRMGGRLQRQTQRPWRTYLHVAEELGTFLNDPQRVYDLPPRGQPLSLEGMFRKMELEREAAATQVSPVARVTARATRVPSAAQMPPAARAPAHAPAVARAPTAFVVPEEAARVAFVVPEGSVLPPPPVRQDIRAMAQSCGRTKKEADNFFSRICNFREQRKQVVLLLFGLCPNKDLDAGSGTALETTPFQMAVDFLSGLGPNLGTVASNASPTCTKLKGEERCQKPETQREQVKAIKWWVFQSITIRNHVTPNVLGIQFGGRQLDGMVGKFGQSRHGCRAVFGGSDQRKCYHVSQLSWPYPLTWQDDGMYSPNKQRHFMTLFIRRLSDWLALHGHGLINDLYASMCADEIFPFVSEQFMDQARAKAILSATGRRIGEYMRDNNLGIFAADEETRRMWSVLGGLATFEARSGIFVADEETRRGWSRQGGEAARDRGTGVFAADEETRQEWARLGMLASHRSRMGELSPEYLEVVRNLYSRESIVRMRRFSSEGLVAQSPNGIPDLADLQVWCQHCKRSISFKQKGGTKGEGPSLEKLEKHIVTQVHEDNKAGLGKVQRRVNSFLHPTTRHPLSVQLKRKLRVLARAEFENDDFHYSRTVDDQLFWVRCHTCNTVNGKNFCIARHHLRENNGVDYVTESSCVQFLRDHHGGKTHRKKLALRR